MEQMRTLPAASCQTCITSPPYYGLRSYLPPGHPLKHLEIGTEATVDLYVAKLVAVFAEVWRVLKDDGTLWINIGDSYASQGGSHSGRGDNQSGVGAKATHDAGAGDAGNRTPEAGTKAKDLLGVPWRLAFALRDYGWYLRQDIIWHKPSTMPESVTDRCTKAHEYIFLMTKLPKYYFDNDAIKEPSDFPDDDRKGRSYAHHKSAPTEERNGFRPRNYLDSGRGGYAMRNKRSVCSVTNAGYDGQHFATFPRKLIEPCILAGTRPGDTVLDCFGGSGTVAEAALEYGRKAVTCELNPEFVKLIEQRTSGTPGFEL